MGMIYLNIGVPSTNEVANTPASVSNLRISRTMGQFSTVSFDFVVTERNEVAGDMMIPTARIWVPETNEYFQLKNVNRTVMGDTVAFSCSGIGIGCILHNRYVTERLTGAQSLDTCMKLITKDSRFTYRIHDQFKNYSFEGEGFGGGFADDLFLNTLTKNFGFEFEMENYVIHIRKKIGRHSSFLFADGVNAKAVKFTEDYSSIATRITATGKPKESKDNKPTGYMAQVSYTSPKAKFWGVIDAPPISDERFTDSNALLEYCKKTIQDYPLVQYSVDSATFQSAAIDGDVRIGDEGRLKDRHGVDIDVRIISTTESPQGDSSGNTVTFGNTIYNGIDEMLRQRKTFKGNENMEQRLKREMKENERLAKEAGVKSDATAKVTDEVLQSVSEISSRLPQIETVGVIKDGG